MATIEKRNSSGGILHRVKIRVKGFPDQTASFERLTDARRWAQSVETAIREKRYFKTNEAQSRLIGEAIDRYIIEVIPQKAKSCQGSQTAQLLWWKSNIGKYSFADATPSLISDCRNKLIKEPVRSKKKTPSKDDPARYRSPATVVRYMAVLSHMFSVAVKDWEWATDNPLEKVRKPKEPKGRDRFLSDDERARFLTTCQQSDNPYLYPIVVLALSTGMRRGEIMTLRWGMIDLSLQRIILQKTKNGDTRALPLVGQALEQLTLLSKVRRIDTDLVFPGKGSNVPAVINRPWRNAVKQVGLVNFKFHDLRHSAASYLAMNGASAVEIATVLGHKTLQMVKRYAHLNDAHTRQIVTSMNNKIFAGA